MKLGGLQKSSLIDYPGKICAVIFTQGCNFRCPYCHNPELASKTGATTKAVAPVLEFLNSRKNKLDAVVITGGEPTLQKDLPEFIKEIKKMGFLVKLDTNGTNPKMLQNLLDEKLIEYAAMDIKAPIGKYTDVIGAYVNINDILQSIEIIKNSCIDYEFRTTVVKSQLLPQDFEEIAAMIKGAKKYYLQKFVPAKVLKKAFLQEETYSDEEFCKIVQIFNKHVNQVQFR